MQVNAATREVTCKVVYYGPGMSGKTTNLKIIHERAPRKAVGELITLDTHSERTLHFDLLPMDLGVVRGFALRFEFFTVPGQSYYAATRRLVLEGADAVVFVADSRREALDENIDSMNDLLDNLRHHQLPEDLPVVIQYNKQDLATAPKPEQLDPLLNIRRWQRFIAVATAGQGVLETLNSVTALVVERVKQHPALAAPSGQVPALAASLAAAPSNRTWLITCYRCQNMLEITNAKPGDLFTCGACGTALEVNNLEHGLTRAPLPAALSAGVTQPINMNEEVAAPGSGGYSMQPLAAADGPALNTPGAPASTPGGMPFEIDGFDQLALLDETVQGRRFRVRERASGTAWRALVLSPTLMRQPGYQPQLEPYARLAAQIKHPHILPLGSLRAGRETPILMSAAPADYESLAHVLARRRTLAPPHALGVARMIALALEEAARHGVIHGWLRPDVILLSPDGNTLVDEFGLPKHHRYLVRELAGASAATEYYLAPEHLSDDARSDARSDIFMLGALLFRMMTGEGLVCGYNAHEALHKISAQGCRNLRAVNPQISRDLDAFFVRMVAVERRDRFQNYREVIDQLDKFGGGAKRGTLRLTGSVNAANPGTRPTRAPGGRVGPGGGSGTARRPVGGSSGHRTLPPSAEAHAPGRSRQEESNAFLIVAGVLLVVALVGAMLYLSKSGSNLSNGYSSSRNSSGTTGKPTTFPIARDLYSKHSNDRDPSQTVIERSTTRTPAAGTATPGTGAPTTATKIEPAKTPVKAPIQGNPAVAPATGDRAELALQIATLEREDRYGDALALCVQMDAASDAETREWASERGNDVRLRHDNRRKDVLGRLATAADVGEAEDLLKAPLAGTWGMEGDVEWAQDQLASARARLPRTRAADPDAQPTAAVGDPTPSAGGQATDFASADSELELALIAGQTATIEQILAKLDQNTAQSKALRRKAELWTSRADILGSIIRSRKPKLRLPHPTIGEQWDVTDAERGGVQITSPAGSSTRLEWTQVALKDLGRIAREAADHPQAESRDYALACVLLLMSGDTALASVQTIKGKAAIDEPTARDLDALIALKRGREVGDAIARADAAATQGDLKALDDAIALLKRLDRDKQPRAHDALARLDPVRARLAEGKATAEDVPAKDDLAFDEEDDVKSFPLRQGAWNVGNGQVSLVGESGSLARKDMGNARSLTVTFQNNGGKGAMTINFRGVRVLAEFGANRITVASREQESRGKEFAFLPKTMHSIYLRANREAGTMAIEVNNGAEVFEVKSGALTDQLMISADNNPALAIEELSIGRDGTHQPGNDPATTARHEAVRNQTGCEPLGGVYLDPPTIVLPAPEKGVESGLAFLLRESATSITVDVKGKGQLQLLLGQFGKDGGDFVNVDLKPDPQRLTISWRGALVVKNEQGLVIAENKNLGKDHSHLMILAASEAVLMVSPKLNRE